MLKTYLKIAYRNLSHNKTYGFLNVMGLALSITCGILIFSLVKYHLSFDNFHKDPNRIYRFVTEQHRDVVSYTSSVPPAFGNAFRNDYSFGEQTARIVIYDNEQISIESPAGIKKFRESTGPVFAEPGYFRIFNFPLVRGDEKTILSEPNTAIITESLAYKYFGNEDPINKVFRLGNKIDCKITGVLKDLPVNSDQQAELYISWPTLSHFNNWLSDNNAWGGISSNLQCFVRLHKNVSPAEVEKVLPAYVKKFRPTHKNVHHYKLQPLAEMHFDGRYGGSMEKRNIWILSFIGLFLIITACVNFINLATAQALRRSKEVGIKKVLGSLRSSLFWQFIAETALITITATTLAFGASYLLLPSVNAWFRSQISIDLFNDWQLLVFTPLLIILVTFLAGFYPGLILSGFRPIAALKGKLSMQQIGGFNIRRGLIVTQFSISLILIISMIVITRQMQYAKQSELGFNKDAIVMLPLEADSMNIQVTTLKNKLSNIPGVEKVSLCYAAPAAQENWFNSIRFDNRPEFESFRVNIKAADDQYLPTFDLKLVAGRNMFPSDSVREFLVNETMIGKLGLSSPQDAIGKKIFFNGGTMSATIVGVLKDFHDQSFHEDISALCITTHSELYNNYAIKVNTAKITSVLPALEAAWSSMHPDKIYGHQFLDERIAGFYETEATMLQLISVFSLIAILIGCLGLYGLVAFMVSQKTKEIGIRKVLGSSMREILWIFGKEFALLILIAFLIAAPFGWWLMNNWLQDFEYHVTIGPWVFVSAALLIGIVTAVTVGYQSMRAALMNPVKSLRTE
jgi:putative ABC transport system permease protein